MKVGTTIAITKVAVGSTFLVWQWRSHLVILVSAVAIFVSIALDNPTHVSEGLALRGNLKEILSHEKEKQMKEMLVQGKCQAKKQVKSTAQVVRT